MTSIKSQPVSKNRRLDYTPEQWIDFLKGYEAVVEIDSGDGRPLYVTYIDNCFYVRTYKSDIRTLSNFMPEGELADLIRGCNITPYDLGELSLFNQLLY